MKKALFIAILLVFCYSTPVLAVEKVISGLAFIDKETGLCHYVVYYPDDGSLVSKRWVDCDTLKDRFKDPNTKDIVKMVEKNIRSYLTYLEDTEFEPSLCFEVFSVVLWNGEFSTRLDYLPCERVPEYLRKKG